jgi:hypothetical protein
VTVVDIEFATNLSFSFTVSKIVEESSGMRPPSMKARGAKPIIKVMRSSINGIGRAMTEAKNTRRLMLAIIYLPRCCSLYPLFFGVANLESTVPSIGAKNKVAI